MPPGRPLTRPELLEYLVNTIVSVERPHPVRVAIDGVDSAGKTTLADELVAPIERKGRPVIRASVDGFHRPRAERYRRGQDSPGGYYHDSFDYESLREELLEQLGPGGSLRYRRAIFDYTSDVFLYESLETAQPDAVLLFDGIFLLRPELDDLWDIRIFLEVDIQVATERLLRRDQEKPCSEDATLDRINNRYVPGQRIYLETVRPRQLADVVVDNNNLASPKLLAARHPES